MAGTVAKQGRALFARYKDWRARARERAESEARGREAAARQQRLKDTRQRVEVVLTVGDFFEQSIMREIAQILNSNTEDLSAIESLVSSEKFRRLETLSLSVRKLIVSEREMFEPTFAHEVRGRLLLSTLDERVVKKRIRQIIDRHTSSSGVNIFNPGVGGAVRHMAVAFDNGSISGAFSAGIPSLVFRTFNAEITESHTRYIRMAHRMVEFGVGDRSTVERALFGLVVNDWACSLDAGAGAGRMDRHLGPEFRAEFGNEVWPTRACAAKLDQQAASLAQALRQENDLKRLVRLLTSA